MTSKKAITGKCRICGKEGKLTFEHIPPRASYNKQLIKTVKLLDVIEAENKENIMPWELGRVPYNILQRGRGQYCLCERCNNNTGAWYGSHYKKFADALMYICLSLKKANARSAIFELNGMRPLPIFKQIIAMFCDINTAFTDNDPTLRDYLLDKESRSLDTRKYRVFIYFLTGGIEKTVGRTAVVKVGDPTPIIMSEISTFPVGYILYENLPNDYQTSLTEITNFADASFTDSASITLAINAFEISSIFPGDFRSKEEIISTNINNKRNPN